MPASQPDVLLVGGGVIGLTTALDLAEHGLSVTVIDRQAIGQEASWAGAGMLPPGTAEGDPADNSRAAVERFLRCRSNKEWGALSERLLEKTGIDNGFRQCGAVELGLSTDQLREQTAVWDTEGVQYEVLEDRSGLQTHVPALADEYRQGVWLPEFRQVRNPRHLKALLTACRMSGVGIVEGASDLTLQSAGRRVQVTADQRRFDAARVCVTAGCWSGRLLNGLGIDLPVRPVRGQVVQLRVDRLPFRCVLEHGRRYLVPRPDGLILVGSTEEDAGFDRRTTGRAVEELLRFAISVVPELADAEPVRQWAGLRPASADGLPYVGQVEHLDNLFVAAGHFRSGLQMSPGTASVLRQMMLEQPEPAVRALFPPPGRAI